MRTSPPRRLPALTLAAVLVLLSGLAACGGSDDEPGSDEASQTDVDPDAQACRDQWSELAEEVESGAEEETPTPSSLRSRYVTLTAQIDYYATSATADDCGTTLEDEEATITGLTTLSESLAPYDTERRLATLEADETVTSYARPQGEAGADAPRPARVTQALTDLRRLAPQATAEQSAAWQQAAVVDVRDEAARTKAVSDLEVVSGESTAYQQAQQALAVLDRAAATG